MAAHPVQDRRLIIYPTYIDSTVTVSGGRYITKEQAVPTPDVLQLLAACEMLKVPVQPEEKHYSRTWWIRGRLRVQLKNPDGTLIHPDIPNKRTLLIKIAEIIKQNPNLPRRTPPFNIMVQQLVERFSGAGGGSSSKAAQQAAGGSGGAAASSSAGGGGGSSKKRKGKK